MKPFLCPRTFNKRYELICVSAYIRNDRYESTYEYYLYSRAQR